jgi:6,7-dimethyl-8-ribityllumazine synthase
MAVYVGDFRTPAGRFALVAARFNGVVVERLVEGAIDGLTRHGVAAGDIDVFHVPGSLELPLIARRAASSGKYVAVLCLGAVVRGETAHFDIVAHGSAQGIAAAAVDAGVPILNAVLTTDTVEQALDRAGAKQGNKGFDAALAAIEMVNLLAQLSEAEAAPPASKNGAAAAEARRAKVREANG